MENLELIKELLTKVEEIKNIGRKLGYNNILYNEQYKELEISIILGHIYNEGQGEDAINMFGEGCEYKTMMGEKGSFQYHWISKDKLEKLRKTPHHYFITYSKETGRIDKIYYLSVDKFIKDIEIVYLNSENKRKIINENSKVKKSKNIDAHKSYTLNKIKSMGAKLIYSVQ